MDENELPETFSRKVAEHCERDSRYDSDAYEFVYEALNATLRELTASDRSHAQNVSSRELLAGIKGYALKEFGPMAYTVLTEWGLKDSADFGEILFALARLGLVNTSDGDAKDDFRGAFTFREAFQAPFLPREER